MKFCSGCKKLNKAADTVCGDCGKKYKEISDINEPVLLCVTGGVERVAVCGALKDAQIPFVEAQHGKLGVSNEIVTGYDAKLLNIAVLVPYSAVPKACETLQAVGIDCPLVENMLDDILADIEQYKQNGVVGDFEPMSNAKRTTVKVLSAIAFVIIVALVIFGTDYVMELIKNLFGG